MSPALVVVCCSLSLPVVFERILKAVVLYSRLCQRAASERAGKGKHLPFYDVLHQRFMSDRPTIVRSPRRARSQRWIRLKGTGTFHGEVPSSYHGLSHTVRQTAPQLGCHFGRTGLSRLCGNVITPAAQRDGNWPGSSVCRRLMALNWGSAIWWLDCTNVSYHDFLALHATTSALASKPHM